MSMGIAVLGATGTVGQKIITMIENHPKFHVAEVAASERSEGKVYGAHTVWRDEGTSMPDSVKGLTLKNLKDVTAPYALSALPADSAREIEPFLAEKGTHVISNASAFRMGENIPLVVPEINKSHLELTSKQNTKGKIITNPNCSTVFATLGLAPLVKIAPIEHISIVTLQAISGAGYPGISSMDILGNIVPNIGGEEEKIEEETKKILGSPGSPAEFSVTAHVHRVPVIHGHTVAMHVFFKENVSEIKVYEAFENEIKTYPELYKIHRDSMRPQPLRDITPLDQRAHIGRIKQGDRPHIVGLVSQGHNLVRGAAGAALLNLESAVEFFNQ